MTEEFPESEMFRLSSPILRAAGSSTLIIGEGSAGTAPGLKKFLVFPFVHGRNVWCVQRLQKEEDILLKKKIKNQEINV